MLDIVFLGKKFTPVSGVKFSTKNFQKDDKNASICICFIATAAKKGRVPEKRNLIACSIRNTSHQVWLSLNDKRKIDSGVGKIIKRNKIS